MKTEVAARLRAELHQLPLGTTAGSKTAHGGPLTEDEVRKILKAHDNAIGILITDAEKRRRDVQIVADTGARLEAAHQELMARPVAELVAVEQEQPSIGWLWVVAATTLGGTASLHLAEIAALAWLWWHR